MPSVVGSPVRSLAGFQSSPRGSVPVVFEDPVPLGVRFHSIVNPGERWVTRWVDDIQFRSVVPGGFASATITLRIPRNLAALPAPDPLGFSRLAELFTRVQVVDLRTMEIAWEGRVEDPARQVEPDTWQIGALGSMVAATDISRTVFYIDSSLDRWITADMIDSSGDLLFGDNPDWAWSAQKNDVQRSLTTTYKQGYPIFDSNHDYSWRWDSHGYDQPIARFTLTQKGFGPNSTQSGSVDLVVGIAANPEVQNTNFSVTETTKSSVIGTDFTDTNTRYIVVGSSGSAGSAEYKLTTTDSMVLRIREPKIIGKRCGLNGYDFDTAANYTTDYVTVSQVVEDVVGRFLVGGWYQLAINEPLPGSVRSTDVYIDASNTTQILHLIYPTGATAADILNDLVNQVQTNAYWAIWESKWTASSPDADFPNNSGFRFEWATWPANWGYLASSQDGFEGQPNGANVVNFVSHRYQDTGDANAWHVDTEYLGNEMAPELLSGGFTRSVTLNKADPTDGTTASNLAVAYLANSTVLNAGTLTVKRPIAFYDAGTNSASGGARMLDPWMIRPGRLVKITDLPPRAYEHDVSAGTTAPDASQNGTIFRVVATEYSSADNSCRMELDQVTRWQVPTQISSAASGASKTIRIQ